MKKTILSFALLLSFFSLWGQTGEITDLQVSQRSDDEVRVVDIAFNLVGTGEVYEISLEVSFDNGDTFNTVDPDEITGSIYVSAGPVQLVWDGRAKYPEYFSEEARIRVNATRGVMDIDGNFYRTILFSMSPTPSKVIDHQEWMAENLRVSRYNNGQDIPSGLSIDDWKSTSEGAYAIYPHTGGETEGSVEGIDSDEEMVAAYGKLYNWYAVDDARGLCPTGWSVASYDDWNDLVNHLMSEYGYHNSSSSEINGVGNALKSCRQVDSPLEGCNTSEHPRWDAHSTHYGFDEFGFSALSGGQRNHVGVFEYFGTNGYWWSSTVDPTWSDGDAWTWFMYNFFGTVDSYGSIMKYGHSVRCVKDAGLSEDN